MRLKQFDVCILRSEDGDPTADFVIVLQHEALNELETRVVVPLVQIGKRIQIDRITPVVDVNGVVYAVAMHLMAAVSNRDLGPAITNLRDRESMLKRAIDVMFFGN